MAYVSLCVDLWYGYLAYNELEYKLYLEAKAAKEKKYRRGQRK